MKTGDHILNLASMPHATGMLRSCDLVTADCSCGLHFGSGITAAHARILHGTHFDAILNDARDAEQAVQS